MPAGPQTMIRHFCRVVKRVSNKFVVFTRTRQKISRAFRNGISPSRSEKTVPENRKKASRGVLDICTAKIQSRGISFRKAGKTKAYREEGVLLAGMYAPGLEKTGGLSLSIPPDLAACRRRAAGKNVSNTTINGEEPNNETDRTLSDAVAGNGCCQPGSTCSRKTTVLQHCVGTLPGRLRPRGRTLQIRMLGRLWDRLSRMRQLS